MINSDADRETAPKPSQSMTDLLAIMAALRDPVSGCPWDVKQTFETIAPYTIEEAYEVIDAIARGDMVDLKDELGDLLLQVVFHARLAEEQSLFSFGDVVEAITSKLIRRHPHVFGRERALSPDDVKRVWDDIKALEKAERRAARAARGLADDEPPSLLDGVPEALPALTRAEKLQSKASKVGFDWNDYRLVLEKAREELAEIEEAIAERDPAHIEEEVGDLLFVIANLARHVKVDPEAALRRANRKFVKRFNYIEQILRERGRPVTGASLEEMESLWQDAKAKV